MYTEVDRAEEVLKLLIEGCSISTIERFTGLRHGTILKILVIAGEKCEKIMVRKIRNVEVRDVELDELGASSERSKSACDPMTIKTLATATRSWRLNDIPSWCSISQWGSVIKPPLMRSLKACDTRPPPRRTRSQPMAFRRTSPRSPRR
jgi:hypothetical protein